MRSKAVMPVVSLRSTGTAIVATALALASSTGAACGGTKQTALSPLASATGTAAQASAPVVNKEGQQVGVTSGPAADTELTGSAKDAYDRGFAAWAAGDLPTARTAFSDAASKAPKAAGPRYSLGCVLERLGDTQGAVDAYRASYSLSSKYEFAM